MGIYSWQVDERQKMCNSQLFWDDNFLNSLDLK